MRGNLSRGLRLNWVAALGVALAMPAMAMAAGDAQSLATQTTLSAETRDLGGRTQTTVTITVTGEDGSPATGAVVLKDGRTQLSGVALDAQGRAQAVLSLAGGDHALRAVYAGDSSHLASTSAISGVHALDTGAPSFTVTVAPASLSLTAGQSGTVIASVIPSNASALTAPIFVALSCSGTPDQSSCNFTPTTVEILPTTASALTSTMVLTTQAASAALTKPAVHREASPITWAILFPGALGLAGLAFSGRRRRWLSRVSLLGLVCLVSILGATACNPRYNYLNHGPPTNPSTPVGTYTLKVNAQSSNGVTAYTTYTNLVLTVK